MKKIVIAVSLLIWLISCVKKDDNVIQYAYMFPNPFSAQGTGLATFRVGFKQAVTNEQIAITVYDLTYQVIWQNANTVTSNPFDISWGGENNSGIVITPGIYIVKISLNGSLNGEEWFRIIVN
ncbi:MAG: T9SS type A sorting domain-containing protein [Spirochaetota bacterium]|nr:T9SS type A sorting domain-containing protein [Spirochaetota bacterium]